MATSTLDEILNPGQKKQPAAGKTAAGANAAVSPGNGAAAGQAGVQNAAQPNAGSENTGKGNPAVNGAGVDWNKLGDENQFVPEKPVIQQPAKPAEPDGNGISHVDWNKMGDEMEMNQFKPAIAEPPAVPQALNENGTPVRVPMRPYEPPKETEKRQGNKVLSWTDFLDKDGNLDTDKLRNYTSKQRMQMLSDYLHAHPEETPEQKARREKHEKWSKIYSAIGDGVAALANLHYTGRYAPNVQQPPEGLSERAQKRYDMLRQEAENTRLQRLKAYEMLGQMADEADNARYRKQQAEDAHLMQQQKLDIAQVQKDLLEARRKKDEAAAETAQRTLDYMVNFGWPYKTALAQANLDKVKAQTNQANAAAAKDAQQGTAAMIKAEKYKGGGSGSGGGGGKPYGRFNGVDYPTKAEYEKAVVGYAQQNHIPVQYDKQSTNRFGQKSTVKTNRTIAALAADGERHHVQQVARAKAAKAQAAAAAKAKSKSSSGANRKYKNISIRKK